MPRLLKLFVQVFIAASITGAPESLSAAELTGFAGAQNFEAVNGCCQSVPFKSGFGLSLRADVLGGVYEGFGYTDRRWAEISILKTSYITGQFTKPDPEDDDSTTVTRLQKWQVLFSYGLGFYIHTTTTTKFNLPIVVNGVLAVGHLETQYSLNDRISFVALARIGGAGSFDSLGLIAAGLGGVLVRF